MSGPTRAGRPEAGIGLRSISNCVALAVLISSAALAGCGDDDGTERDDLRDQIESDMREDLFGDLPSCEGLGVGVDADTFIGGCINPNDGSVSAPVSFECGTSGTELFVIAIDDERGEEISYYGVEGGSLDHAPAPEGFLESC